MTFPCLSARSCSTDRYTALRVCSSVLETPFAPPTNSLEATMTDAFNRLVPVGGYQPDPTFANGLRDQVIAIESDGNSRTWHLAQLNLGVFKAPLESPEMQPFVNALERINAIADASPGFVWRMTDEDGGPSSYVDVPGADDPLLASNLSVWTDLESLRTFMYKTDHASYLRRRVEWFDSHSEAMTVAWWIPAGERPTLTEAVQRLEDLRENGPTDKAFPLTKKIPNPPAAPKS